MNSGLTSSLSKAMATVMVRTVATAHGGTVSYCACAAVSSSPLMLVGRKSERVYNGKLMVWKPRSSSQILGSSKAEETFFQVKALLLVASILDASRDWTHARSLSVRNLAVEG